MVDRLIKEQFNRMKPFITHKVTIYDINGDVIISNIDDAIDVDDELLGILKQKDDYTEINGCGYEWISINGIKVCLISFEGLDYDTYKEIIKLIKLNIETIIEADKNILGQKNFYKDIMVGNIKTDKISSLCFDYNMSVSQEGYVLLVEYGSGVRENGIEEMLMTFFTNAKAVQIDQTHTVFIYDFKEYEGEEQIGDIVKGLVDEIRLESVTPLHIGIGSRISDIFQLKDSYDKAVTALSVGKIFYTDEYVYDYAKIGIAKLIYSLPDNVCEQFLKDVLPGEAILFFSDKEILNTVKMFFQSNLNMSVAARELYIHRNTLVYRLDKINKLTGYNLANFDDAVIIKAALMIKDYLDRYAAEQGG